MWPCGIHSISCSFHCKVPQFCYLKNGQSEYSQETREHQLVPRQLWAGLSLPWHAALLLPLWIHHLLNFWLEYEIYEGCYSCSQKACVMVWVVFADTLSKAAWCELVEERWKVCSTYPQLCQGTVKILMVMGRDVLGGRSLTSSSKSPLYSCAESQMRSIPHTPALLLLSPGHWHRNNQLAFSKHFHCDCTKNGI